MFSGGIEVEQLMMKMCEYVFNPLTTNVLHHIETSQVTCSASQLTGFYMMGKTGR